MSRNAIQRFKALRLVTTSPATGLKNAILKATLRLPSVEKLPPQDQIVNAVAVVTGGSYSYCVKRAIF
jgi:hypothetical protein